MGIINVDYRDRKPIYEQIIDNVTTLVIRGLLQPNEQLPSVRVLASELAINPNTIQKSYSELEKREVIYSIQGRGSYISPNIEALKKTRENEILKLLEKLLYESREIGMEKQTIKDCINKVWRDNND